MSKRCTKCGTFLADSDRFCPSCGENAPQEVNSAPVYEAAPSQNSAPADSSGFEPNGQQTQYAPPPYAPSSAPQYNAFPRQEEEMSVGRWLLTIFLTSLGLVGLVLLFVWGFGDGPKARQNYCKAMLIFWAIAIGLYILFIVFIFGIVGVTMNEILNEYTTYDALSAVMSFFRG